MGERASYTPGTFSWVDLASPDQEASKRFYGELFGWELTDNPVGDGDVYTMASIGGRNVAAIAPQPRQQRDAGVPPMWQSYVTVTSADETLERARELSGNVHAGPFDVMEAGRMGVVQDPQGAFFMVWEPRRHPGAGLVNAHGALCWNELATPDVEASATFYGRLFEWTTETMDAGGMPYRVVKNRDGATNGGLRPAASTEPCYWLVYFATDDLDETLATLRRLGGKQLMEEPMTMGPSRLIAVQDPQGAVFALYTGHLDE
ncbi:MAG TPA: VOC family protein [Solirubrobacteraceae bacterium]|nr:VOC family protein [Solirubrobacteraceae bacterium]